MKFKSFSVSMSVYINDNPNHFKLAVESIYDQTVVPGEVILVIDGPVTKKINSIIDSFKLKYDNFTDIKLDQNLGHGEARRIGLEKCNNELVALMDSDDISLPDRFEKQLAIFNKNNDLSIVGGNIDEFKDDINNIIGSRIVRSNDKDIKRDLRFRCPMNQMTVMFKKDSVISAGGYVDWFCNEDYYLWARMALNKCKFANIDETLVYVRTNNDFYRRRGGYKYFSSEAKLQKFMYSNHLITLPIYIFNVSIRFFLQVLFSNKLRELFFKLFFRKNKG